MHVAELCITDFRSLKAVAKMLQLTEVIVSRKAYQQIMRDIKHPFAETPTYSGFYLNIKKNSFHDASKNSPVHPLNPDFVHLRLT